MRPHLANGPEFLYPVVAQRNCDRCDLCADCDGAIVRDLVLRAVLARQ